MGMVRASWGRVLRLSLLGLAVAGLLASCSRVAQAPKATGGIPPELLNELAPMPPKTFQTAPLPELQGTVPLTQGLAPLAVTPSRVAMKILVVSATDGDPGLEAITTMLDQIGTPYDVLLAADQPLTAGMLVGADGTGSYQGVVLANGSLAYESSPGVWDSAFDWAEWNLLWQYERDYAVRQIALYTYPSTYPEDYGIRATSASSNTLHASLTTAGSQIFSYLQPTADIEIRYAYTYLGTLDASGGVSATPLLKDSSGDVLAVSSTSADGRERIALTFASNPWLMHAQLLGYGLVDWVTKGVFLGQRRAYAGVELDDWFLATDRWDASLGGLNGEYRMTAADVLNARDDQARLRSDYPLASQLTLSMAFNGEDANTKAKASCSPSVGGPDPLSSLTRCVLNDFRWVNHTYSHAYMDWTNYDQSKKEITRNRNIANKMGIKGAAGYYARSLVTGDISGLGWYNPAGPDAPGAKIDFGLLASNPDFLNAAVDTNIRVVASNMSVTSHQPSCFGCGIYHPMAPSLLLIPRYPTNVFYAATTPADMVDLYNSIYGPAGSGYFDHNLTYAEYLDFDTDIALMHILQGAPYYHYMHVGNLREYAPGRSLAYDWLHELLGKYSALYDLPLESLGWKDLEAAVADRTSYFGAGIRGVIDWTARTATLTSQSGGVALATGLRFGQNALYDGEVQSRKALAAGGSLTVSIP